MTSPYTFLTVDGLDYGASTSYRRARETAARICRERQAVVIFVNRGERWQLTPQGPGRRATWTLAEEAA